MGIICCFFSKINFLNAHSILATSLSSPHIRYFFSSYHLHFIIYAFSPKCSHIFMKHDSSTKWRQPSQQFLADSVDCGASS